MRYSLQESFRLICFSLMGIYMALAGRDRNVEMGQRSHVTGQAFKVRREGMGVGGKVCLVERAAFCCLGLVV